MRKKIFVYISLVLVVIVFPFNNCFSQKEDSNNIKIKDERVAGDLHLLKEKKTDCQDAINYVSHKFDTYDIVILGEHHWVQSELDFTNKLLPYLYNYGVKTFAFEFLSQDSQDKLNLLMQKNTFDYVLLNKIISYKPRWYIKEYEQLLYSLWQLNKNKDICIIACDASENDNSLDRDSLMAINILSQYKKTEEKIFVYCGSNHSFTDFYQYVGKEDSIKRMGNILFDKYPKSVFNINFFPAILLNTSNIYCVYNLPTIDTFINKEYIGLDMDSISFKNHTFYDKHLARNPKHSLGDIFNGVIILNQSKIQICEPDETIEKYSSMFEEYKEISNIFKTIKQCNCNN